MSFIWGTRSGVERPVVRSIRRIEIERDSLKNWRIRLYYNKGRCRLLPMSYGTHTEACTGAGKLQESQLTGEK